jgi:hypothetical protein
MNFAESITQACRAEIAATYTVSRACKNLSACDHFQHRHNLYFLIDAHNAGLQ